MKGKELPGMVPAPGTTLRPAREKQGKVWSVMARLRDGTLSPSPSSYPLFQLPLSPLLPYPHLALTCEHCGLLSLMSRTKISTGTEAWNLPSEAVIRSKYLAVCSRSRVFLEKILHSSPTWLMPNWPRGSPSRNTGQNFLKPSHGNKPGFVL